jgi:peroxiredoxin
MTLHGVIVGAICLVSIDALGPARMASGEPQTTTSTAANDKERRTAVLQKIQEASSRLSERFPNRFDLLDEDRRDDILRYGLPELQRLVVGYEDLHKLSAKGGTSTVNELSLMIILASWNDVEANASLEMLAKEQNSPLAVLAAAGQLVAQWMQARHAPERQAKVLGELHQLAAAHAEEDLIVPLVMMMYRHGAASSELRDGVTRIVTNDLQGPKAKQVARKLANHMQMRKLENQPLVLSGITLEGKSFSTATWKNKVIVVSFWATWCSACRVELPRLKGLYAKYHDRGLEVLGISCDNDIDALQKFVLHENNMPWPQLCNATNAERPILAEQYNVRQLPTVFLIDRAGVLRSVTARDNGEKMVLQLLNEPASTVRNDSAARNDRAQQAKAPGTEILGVAERN